MSAIPTLNATRSALLIVDMQEKLAPHVHESSRVVSQMIWLIRAAQTFSVPIMVSEHCANKIGGTLPALKEHLSKAVLVEKTSFSLLQDAQRQFWQYPQAQRPQWVLTGMETHICVLQTAMDLLRHGHQVFVVAEASSSINIANHQQALERMRSVGIHIINGQSVLYEWMHDAKHALFGNVLERLMK